MSVRTTSVFLALAMVFNVAMARQSNAPLYNPERVTLKRMDGQPSTTDQVRKAILMGSQPHGWKVLSDEPGSLKLQYIRPKGAVSAVVRIEYDAQSYKIHYVTSEGLFKEGEGADATIHPTYNSWMKYLLMRIMVPGELVPSSAATASTASAQ